MSNDIEKRSAEDLVKEFRDASVSESTRKAYRSDLEAFVGYCEWKGVAALPATQETVCLYLAELVRHKRSVNTIIRALTAINKAHEIAGYPGVRTPEVKAVLKGIKRKNDREKRKASGISYAELWALEIVHCFGSGGARLCVDRRSLVSTLAISNSVTRDS